MILADTTVWVDHFRATDDTLAAALSGRGVVMHPFVLGELAVGNFRDRAVVLGRLAAMPLAARAADYLVLQLIDAHQLHGLGLSYIDVHLLASTRLTAGLRLWTRDRRLHAAADRLGIAFA